MKIFKFAAVLCLILISAALTAAEKRAKYVFLFIGDGMGETIRKYYQHEYPDSALEKFPVTVRTSTVNSSGKVTDSAASGTAIACGIKTYNGAIGVDDKVTPVTSLAKILRDKNYSIAIISSVAVNDATPAAHYANRRTRRDYSGVLSDLYASNFDFFAGGALLLSKGYPVGNYQKLLKQVGYDFCNNFDFNEKTPKNRVLFVSSMEPDWPAKKQPRHLLSEVTGYAIKCLSNNPQGFFMLIEGGAIDHCAHNNDLAGVMRHMREFDLAVKTALEFQKKHPDETLIIITSDHDTGGMNIKEFKGDSMWKKQLQRAVIAQKLFARELKTAPAEKLIASLTEYFGMGKLSDSEMQLMLKAVKEYRNPELRDKKNFRSMYGRYNPVIVQMMRLRDARCGVTWSSFSHTVRKVLTNAQGAGENYFKAVSENSDIPHAISRAMLGKDVMTQAAKSLPHLVEKNAEEYFNFISLNDKHAIFRYGQRRAGDLDFVFQGKDKSSKFKRSDRAGRILIKELAADTEYTMQVKRAGKIIAERKIKTLAAPAGNLIARVGVIADPHVSLYPDVRYGRMHSKSVEALETACKRFIEQKVDFIALPGDVTDASKLPELTAAGKVLEKFKHTRFYGIPGNHDLMNVPAFKAQWNKLFGSSARVEKHGKLQILLLDTFNGRLADKKENIAAIMALDPTLPVLVFSHYQLVPDTFIRDRKKAISDGAAAADALKKLAAMNGAIIVGHKNIATTARLGKLIQINAPQLTQFPAGGLLMEIYSNGMRLEFQPMLDEFYDEYSRLRGNAMKQKNSSRDKHSLQVWNAFYAIDFSAGK